MSYRVAKDFPHILGVRAAKFWSSCTRNERQMKKELFSDIFLELEFGANDFDWS